MELQDLENQNPTVEELEEFAERHGWEKQMKENGGFSNYSGTNFGDLVVVGGSIRDDDEAGESNFQTILELLGGESKTVTIARIGHWACGYTDLIMVDPTDTEKLTIAFNIHAALDEYPILDEEDVNDKEHDRADNFAKQEQESAAKALSKHFGVRNTKALKGVAYLLNMSVQTCNGLDDCINLNEYHKPSQRDLDQLAEALAEVLGNWNMTKSEEKTVIKLLDIVTAKGITPGQNVLLFTA